MPNPNYAGYMTRIEISNPTLHAEILALEIDPEAAVSPMAKRIFNTLLKDKE